MKRPFEKLVENAGLKPLEVLTRLKPEDSNYGFNVETEAYGNLLEMGIIDPTRVAKNAVQNGASVAAMILTTEAIITNIPETPKQ